LLPQQTGPADYRLVAVLPRGDGMKVKLSNHKVEQLLKRLPVKGREDYWDTLLPGWELQLSGNSASYKVGGRFGNTFFCRLKIGDAREMDFEPAKAKARVWLDLDANGKDPRIIEAAKAAAEAAQRAYTLSEVANQFLTEWVIGAKPDKPRQRRWFEVKRHVAVFTDKWGPRPIVEIERDEAVKVIKAKARTAPAEARNLLGVGKQLWGWGREQDFGLRHNIMADIKPRMVCGDKVSRERAPNIEEAGALYAVAAAMPYPFGPAFQLLILSGLRLNECVAGRWREIDLKNKTWTIPASRMKGRQNKTRPFEVPLTDRMIAILNSLPHFAGGDYLFTTTGGEKPIVLGSKAKQALDTKVQLAEPWQIHDLRRAIRSGMAKLGIADEVAEAVLAHKQPGIRGVYNVHPYFDERRTALEQWGEAVDPPSNVTRLRNATVA
jgi:integrase